jgi:putative alpha-1,2-mannosidase
MISRRRFTAAGLATFCLSVKKLYADFARPFDHGSEMIGQELGVSRFVKVEIGTGGHGHCYPGATVPFGLVCRVQLLRRVNHGIQPYASEWDRHR